MKIAIVTDSTAYIPAQLVKQYAITVAPQVLIWGGDTFRDGVDIQPDEFYAAPENKQGHADHIASIRCDHAGDLSGPSR